VQPFHQPAPQKSADFGLNFARKNVSLLSDFRQFYYPLIYERFLASTLERTSKQAAKSRLPAKATEDALNRFDGILRSSEIIPLTPCIFESRKYQTKAANFVLVRRIHKSTSTRD
jgi:hypothetical protein